MFCCAPRLALLSEAGRRQGGASAAVDFLFTAAQCCQSDLPVVLLRAHAAREGGTLGLHDSKSGRGCGWFVGLLEDCIGFVRV